MHFQPESVPAFLELFDEVKHHIRNFPGCKELKLMQEDGTANVLFTYSIWESNAHLEAYRNSPFFAETWRKTKALFAAKAQAFSMVELQQITA